MSEGVEISDASFLSSLRDRIASDIASRVRVSVNSNGVEPYGVIALGIYSAGGRQLGASFRRTATDLLELSDDGESWGELVLYRLVAHDPTADELRMLKRLCASYEVTWHEERRAIVAVAEPDKVVDVALRIAAASIAIDGWRVWLCEE